MAYNPTPLVEHAWVRPPRCISGFVAGAVRDPEGLGNVFDELAVFRLNCSCGGASWKILGYKHEEAGFVCPLALECASCGKVAELFDIQEHGYDAEFGHGCYGIRGTGAQERYQCSSCACEVFEALPSFSYQIEPIDDLGEQVVARIEDFFDGFGLDGKCIACSIVNSVSGYECA